MRFAAHSAQIDDQFAYFLHLDWNVTLRYEQIGRNPRRFRERALRAVCRGIKDRTDRRRSDKQWVDKRRECVSIKRTEAQTVIEIRWCKQAELSILALSGRRVRPFFTGELRAINGFAMTMKEWSDARDQKRPIGKRRRAAPPRA